MEWFKKDKEEKEGVVQKNAEIAAGVGDVPKEPRKGYVRRKNHETHDAKADDSSNGKVAPHPKSKVAPPNKSQPGQLL